MKWNINRLKSYPLWRLIGIVWSSSPRWSSVYLFFLTIRGVLPLLQLYVLKLVIDAVAGGINSTDISNTFREVLIYLLIAGVVQLVSVLLDEVGRGINSIHVQYLSDHIHNIIHTKSVEIDLEYYENSRYHDTLHRAQQEATTRPQRLLNNLSDIVQNSVSVIAIAGLLFSLKWFIALVLVVAVLPGVFVRIRFSKIMYAWIRKRTETNRLAYYYSWLMTRYSHAKEIRIFGLGRYFVGKYREIRKTLRTEMSRLIVRRTKMELPAQAFGGVVIFGVYAYIGYMTIIGTITLGAFVMYLQAFRRGLGFLKQMARGMTGIIENNMFISNLFEFLDLQPKIVTSTDSLPFPHAITEGITFNQVSFQYPNSNRTVLHNITLSIIPGEIVAIVGANGSGKTTLIKLLCRLYDPTVGKILIDDVDICRYNLTSLRCGISVIFQDWAKYQFSAADNIRLGNIEQPPEIDRIYSSAGQVGADEFINRLPEGYDNMLGNWFDKGIELSVGEWQKIALARALYREAQIIVLDEPMSSLDVQTEHDVIFSLRKKLKDKLTILISHRLSTLRMADRIIVLEEGKIIEQGSHKELLCKKGVYSQMYETQIRQ
ncbi:MAG: ABC transporter ATP-binding protein [Candidatus Hatepunaea meridiana]|nr:ABC transporter ATP-binding protein [Candidatus Hatepunaea meridiana]